MTFSGIDTRNRAPFTLQPRGVFKGFLEGTALMSSLLLFYWE